MINIKAQVATEYLVIIGLVLVLIIPLTILYSKYSSESSYSITSAKIDSISNEIISAANQVNVYGKDTQVKLTLDFPDNLESINFDNKEIIFKIRGKNNEVSEIVKVSDVSLYVGSFPVTPGKKNVIIKSLGNSILINVQCKNNEFACGISSFPNCGSYGCVLKCDNSAWAVIDVCQSNEGCNSENGECIVKIGEKFEES